MGILRTVAIAAAGVLAYRCWQRHQAGDWSTRAVPDDAGTTPPHGDPRRDDLAATEAAGHDVVGLGGTQGPDTGIAAGDAEPPRNGQSSLGFGG